jgi:hypothetical protein
VFVDVSEGLVGVFGAEDGEALALEPGDERLALELVILDDQKVPRMVHWLPRNG